MSSRQPSPPPALEAPPRQPPEDPANLDDASAVPWPWRLYAGLTAYLGLPVIAAWIALTIAAVWFLPDFGAASGFGLVQLIPSNTPATHAQALEQRLFGSSLGDSQALVVDHATGTLSAATLTKLARQAQAVDSARPASGSPQQPNFAVPLVNVPGLVSATQRPATTAVTFLFFPSSAESGDITAGAQRYAAAVPRSPGESVGVTGPVPAQISEGDIIENALVLLEVVTVVVIAVLVGVVFRSPIAPVVPLAGAGIAYLVARHVLGWGAQALGVQIPSQLAPIVIVLILGVVTDYSVFTLTAMRARLAAGERRTSALRSAASRVVPLVIAAALTVAAGTVALVGANLDFFHVVGPGMAVAVAIAGLVSISFVPAVVGVLGRVAFWPSPPRRAAQTPGRRLNEGVARQLVARLISRRLAAAVVGIACAAALLVAASGLVHARLGTNVVSGLPATSVPRQAAVAAASGFGAGIIGPTTLILQAPGIAGDTAALTRVEQVITSSPGVDAVVGPGRLPLRIGASLFATSNKDAVRAFVVFRDDPYDAAAIQSLTTLQHRVAVALPDAGLRGVSIAWSGATPTAADAVAATAADIWRVAILAALLMSLVLMLYFRAVLAPLLLIASSALGLAASLGVFVDVFQGPLGYPDVTFFVPVTAGVLLVSLGADYSVFVMGRIWEEARDRDMAAAVQAALPRASRAVSIAAVTLAASFAVLALVPVQPFREFAFIMGVGVVIDAFLVRSLLLPALLVLAGSRAFWPHRTGRVRAGRTPAPS
ncbi:MAG TPA: MMPL family transporter [Candidatus Dormibacteraeota bacterium]|jgi:RND superfamily putative drug exporter|nr:MMPL family transporter [Candidatus Dormibacteraeota bacterium]